MNVHKNARSTHHGRVLLVRRVRLEGWRLAEAAGISARTAYKWLARHRAGASYAADGRLIETTKMAA